MGWRLVVQPDGLFARFSEIVDEFTDINLTREEVYELGRGEWGLTHSEIMHKIHAAQKDKYRWEGALEIIQGHYTIDEYEKLMAGFQSQPIPVNI